MDIDPLSSAEPQRDARAADELFEALSAKIYSGELREGDALPPEREIVRQYGVSRTVVREAVLSLANKGLVQARPRYRPVVSRPSYDTAFEAIESVVGRLLMLPGGVRNLFDTRILIEASLVRQAASDARKEDIQALKDALDANGQAVDNSDQFYKTDTEFHGVLYQIPRNPVLPAIHRAYTAWLAPQWAKMPRQPERNRLNHKLHAEIFEAILMRDPDAAEAALRAHLSNAWDQVCQTFGEL